MNSDTEIKLPARGYQICREAYTLQSGLYIKKREVCTFSLFNEYKVLLV